MTDVQAILNQIKDAARKERYNKSKTQLSEAQKQVQNIEKAIDPQRLKNMRIAKAEDTILITLLNNAGFYKSLKGKLQSDMFFTPVNKQLFSVISSRIEGGERVDISHLSQFLTNEETSAVAKLLANQSLVSNTMQECEDCIIVLQEEQKKRLVQNPSQMSDDSFLELFSSLNKDV
jgi:hypothetical protein